MKKFYTILCLLLSLQAVAQQGIPVPEFTAFEATMQRFMQRWNILGASVAFGTQGRLVYARAFGYADVARTVPLQPYHLLRVASLSKPITALAVLKLAEQGRIDLAGKAFGPTGYLRSPYYAGAITDKRIYNVTVQQLLEHTAGWDREIGCDGYAGCDPVSFPVHAAQTQGAPTPVADSTLVRFLLAKGLNYAPGTRFAYSNMGYLALGKIVEKVTGQRYEAWVRTNLLVPAGALEAHLGHNLPAGRLEREVEYQSRYQMPACNGSGQQVPAAYGGFQVEAMSAHGGWVCSARDLVRLQLAAEGNTTRPGLLAPATLATMVAPSRVAPGYAKGWQINQAGNRWHSGSLDGTATYLVRTAGTHTWVILLNSCPGAEGFWQELDQLGWRAVSSAAAWPTHNLLAPAENATALTATEDSLSVVLRWTRGTGTRRLVLMQADAPVDAFPIDNTHYPAATFGRGTVLGRGTYVIANDADDSIRIAKPAPGHDYHIRVVEYADNEATGYRPLYTLDGNPTLVLRSATELALQLYPNPARGQLTVTGAVQPLPYEVLDSKGLLLHNGVLATNQPIPVAELLPGTYFIRFQGPEGLISRRFIKE
ncbi:serine hydrolase [Hymenobacter sp. BT186]|uniref:Serine hydrolase n=1 Tax=Hymenobacter telluris TaxID=2816474 RepID=A0A939ETT4_9BACT|nr:serine hydrolase [Hymenobacter telluris]MBO0356347.1 serine hydrolase [Hymenobacter telluris]MBW3372371.1 serine hydrolase [Hymenobacter norwichensis]